MLARGTAVLISLFAAVVAGTACNAADADERPVAITVDSSRGYPVVRSTGDPTAWTAELVATMGIDSTGVSMFGTVRSVLLDSSGAGYVLDPSYRQIHIFGPDGGFREAWGRQGNGPGEFSSPYSIAWLGDSMAILDPSNARLTLLDAEGRWARQWPVERLTGGSQLRLYRTSPQDFWMIGFSRTDDELKRVFVRYTRDGPTDTVAYFRQPSPAGAFVRCDSPDRSMTFFDQPFGPLPLVVPNAAGAQIVATSTEYRITFIGRANDTLRVIERPVQPLVVTDAVWNEAQREMQNWRKEHPDAHCDRTGFDRVTNKPVLKSIFTDDAGQLWVEVETADGLVYEVFDMDGTLLASVRGLPPSGDVDPSVVAGRIAIVVKDSLDVQAVRVFRLNR